MSERQQWQQAMGARRSIRCGREQTVALVCKECGRDLVYVHTSDGAQSGWASKWFGCNCAEREPLTVASTFEIVARRASRDIRVEAWS